MVFRAGPQGPGWEEAFPHLQDRSFTRAPGDHVGAPPTRWAPLALRHSHLPPFPYKAWVLKWYWPRGLLVGGSLVYLMAGALVMAWDHCVAGLLVLATLGLGRPPHPEPGLPGLWHSYDCGVKGMQLLVFPQPGQTIRFKVVGECQPAESGSPPSWNAVGSWDPSPIAGRGRAGASLQPEGGSPRAPTHKRRSGEEG